MSAIPDSVDRVNVVDHVRLLLASITSVTQGPAADHTLLSYSRHAAPGLVFDHTRSTFWPRAHYGVSRTDAQIGSASRQMSPLKSAMRHHLIVELVSKCLR